MQNIERDLNEAFRGTLSGNYEERHKTVMKVFAEDVKFWCLPEPKATTFGWHLMHVAYGRYNTWGIYQLWAFNNFKTIRVNFHRFVYDSETDEVWIDLLEYCSIWWQIPFLLKGGGPNILLHVILKLKDTPRGKVIEYQEDHLMILESLVYQNMPTVIVRFLENTVQPAVGAFFSTLGNALYERSQRHDTRKKLANGPPSRLVDVKPDLPDMLATLFNGTSCERYALCHTLYAKDAVLWHPFYTVRGWDRIFGAINFWVHCHRQFQLHLSRVVVPDGNVVLVDATQEYKPFWWPPLLASRTMWTHFVLTLADGPNGSKVVARFEVHPLATESTFLANLGPLSTLINILRAVNGIVYGFAGRVIYYACDLYHRQLPLLLNLEAYKPTMFTPVPNRPFALEPKRVTHAKLRTSMDT